MQAFSVTLTDRTAKDSPPIFTVWRLPHIISSPRDFSVLFFNLQFMWVELQGFSLTDFFSIPTWKKDLLSFELQQWDYNETNSSAEGALMMFLLLLWKIGYKRKNMNLKNVTFLWRCGINAEWLWIKAELSGWSKSKKKIIGKRDIWQNYSYKVKK